MTEAPLPKHYTCHYCDLTHKRVEAGGMWFCPNPACVGPGAAYWRSQHLKSYRDKGDQYTVDPKEMYHRGLEEALKLDETEPAIAAAIRRSSHYWLRQANEQELV
jgi:hypothetical protein